MQQAQQLDLQQQMALMQAQVENECVRKLEEAKRLENLRKAAEAKRSKEELARAGRVEKLATKKDKEMVGKLVIRGL